jgi:hypothetical protein
MSALRSSPHRSLLIMRYRLRTLMIVLTILPPMLALIVQTVRDCIERERARRHLKEIGFILTDSGGARAYLPPGGARWNFPPGDMDDGVITMTPIDYESADNDP